MKKKGIGLFLSVILLAMILSACGSKKNTEENKNDNMVYYLNTEENQILSVSYEMKSKNTEKMVEELLDQLALPPSSGDYKAAITEEVRVVNHVIDGNQLILYFNVNYAMMSASKEILTRAAVVRTLIQVPTIQCITFYVDDAPLRDAKGMYVGVMTADTFVENVGQLVTNVSEQNMILYYSDTEGKGLVPVEKKLYSASNLSNEKLIIQHLMEGKEKDGYQSAIPTGTTLLSVSTLDGVCIVNFDDKFAEQNYSIQEDVVIYSIVNSLCELPNVNKVQISINGSSTGVYREEFSLDTIYERNLDLVHVN